MQGLGFILATKLAQFTLTSLKLACRQLNIPVFCLSALFSVCRAGRRQQYIFFFGSADFRSLKFFKTFGFFLATLTSPSYIRSVWMQNLDFWGCEGLTMVDVFGFEVEDQS